MLLPSFTKDIAICYNTQQTKGLTFLKALGYIVHMKLKDYLKKTGHTQTALAKAINGHQSDVSDWCLGNRAVPVRHCLAIVKATGGKVTVQDLRPHDWQLYWS
jgi:hypothetical protein